MQVRSEYNDITPEDETSFPPFGRFDPQEAWDGTINSGKPFEEVVNPLMRSMQCFNITSHFPNGFEVQ